MTESPRSSGNRDSSAGLLRRCWQALFHPSARWSIFALTGTGLIVGLMVFFGFDLTLHTTATNEFCSGCHARNAVVEWRRSSHYLNRSGFIAGCADCHLPQEFGAKMLRKLRGSTGEVWSELRGVIDTPEKYEAHRQEMDKIEWARMRANGARECRHCHHMESMNGGVNASTRILHTSALASGQICTDCHKGVGHVAKSRG